MTMLICDDCGGKTRKPAIDIGLLVLCPSCAPRHGMFTGEHGSIRSYDEWKQLAVAMQQQAGGEVAAAFDDDCPHA